MYAFIGFIALFHIILSISELIVSDSLSEIKLNAKYEEYKECVYPKIHFLGYLLDIMIIMIGGALAYLNRNTEKIYNEKLSIPIYTYILCFVVLRIVDSYKVDINVKVYVEAFGILIYTSTIIYYVYFRRANKIAREKKPLSNNKILVIIKVKLIYPIPLGSVIRSGICPTSLSYCVLIIEVQGEVGFEFIEYYMLFFTDNSYDIIQ
ncbi:hypothetical protein BCR32DRAFT_248219 [Anaeromyces robustus]|uniref:G-protein coupled receptors family 3 profile domain-containing protein n=1 Tax=Anaeromyces robustus TaxID=1754192 RepID=A0A1Y1WUD6_9FUNG|nr:hypothetical protein BCR32DRAFT_248219 [Anaeromyces robustus]|eukprot:ORX77123.1 hypothetical protein BCR32DRAFT_248219 [Anaeromyces robustus]